MAELRIHDQSSVYFKSIRTGDTPKDINVRTPDKSGWLITDKTLQDILNSGANIASSQILKPDITEKPLVNPEAYASLLPIATYRTNDTFVGEHQATEWVASLDSNFNTLIDTTADPIFRDGWYPAVNEPRRKVYVKYRFISEDVCSLFSDTLEFTTPEGGVSIPTLSVVESGSTPTIKGSEFRLYGNLTGVDHIASSWVIYKVSDNSVVKSLPNNSEKLREYKVEEGLLQPETEYKISLVYHTNHPVHAKTRAAIGTYKTPASAISRPTLSFHTEEGRYEVRGTPFTVTSGTDRHKFTTWAVYNGTQALVYKEENSKELTKLNLTGILEPDNDYKVTAIYIGDKSKSNTAAINFRTPTEQQTDLNKLITLSKEAHGGLKITMEKFKMPVAEKLLYLTWTIQNYNNNNPIALEVRLDKDLDDKYDKPLVYDLHPADSWLKWLPNNELTNPVIHMSAKGRVVGEKTVLNYGTQVPLEVSFDYKLGDMSLEDNNTLNPLVKIAGEPTGADATWITKRKVVWELFTREPLAKVQAQETSDFNQHRFTNVDYNTKYLAKCRYYTNFGVYDKQIEFTSRPFTLPKPNLVVTGVGTKAVITATGANLNIPNHPEKSHGSTTWTLYSNTGTKLWQSIKNTSNLLTIDIPAQYLERATEYKVGAIFHSVDDTVSSPEGVVPYTHIGLILKVKDADFTSGTHDNKLFSYGSMFTVKKVYADAVGAETVHTGNVKFKITIKDGDNVVWSKETDSTDRSARDLVANVTYPGFTHVPESIKLDPKKTYKVILDTYIDTVVSSTLEKNFTVIANVKMQHFRGYIRDIFDKVYPEITYGNSSKGGVLTYGNGVGIRSKSSLIKNGTWIEAREYVGEWGDPTNNKAGNLNNANPSDHIGWKTGQYASRKGKLYKALVDQTWNQYDPETDRNSWEEVTYDTRLPGGIELMSKLGLANNVQEGTNTFSYSDRKWSDGLMISQAPENIDYIHIISPTTKKVCYCTYLTSGVTNISWNDLVARQPEYVELDRITVRFGTQLYYVRIPTKEECLLIQTAISDSPMNKMPYIQTVGRNVESIKVLDISKDVDDTQKVVETTISVKARTMNLFLVLTPIPEGEEPYLTENIAKKYPTITYPETELSWSTEGLTYGPDTNYFPAELKLAYDPFTDTGYFGRIPVGKFKSYKDIMDAYGVTGRVQHYDGTGTNPGDIKFYDMFYYHGLIVYIPNRAPWSDMSFDYCKSKGILFGTNMGAYHNYVGDIKLEDNKENWYRVSGLNLYSRNLSNIEQTKVGDAPWIGIKNSILSTLLYKTIGTFKPENVPLVESVQSHVGIVGRPFVIKNRMLQHTDIISYDANGSGNIRGLTGKNLMKNSLTNTLEVISVNEGILFNAKPDNTDWKTCFRPMLTLKSLEGETGDLILSVKITRTSIYVTGQPYEKEHVVTLDILRTAPGYTINNKRYDLNMDQNGNHIAQGTGEALARSRMVTTSGNEIFKFRFIHGDSAAENGLYGIITFSNGKKVWLQDIGQFLAQPSLSGTHTFYMYFTIANLYQ